MRRHFTLCLALYALLASGCSDGTGTSRDPFDLGASRSAPGPSLDGGARRSDSSGTNGSGSETESNDDGGAGRQQRPPSHQETVSLKSCPDEYEDNDSLSEAYSLGALEHAGISLQATLEEDDVYTVLTRKSDPVRVTYEFSEEPEEATFVSLSAFQTLRRSQGQEVEGRLQASKPVSVTAMGKAGERLAVALKADDAEAGFCSAYELTIDAEYCTDPSEDNDTPQDAAPFTVNYYGNARFEATYYDADYYTWWSTNADPVRVTRTFGIVNGSYTDLVVLDDSGNEVHSNGHWITEVEQPVQDIFMAKDNRPYIIGMIPDDDDPERKCGTYEIQVETQWCTDSWEDNDDPQRPRGLDLYGGNAYLEATLHESDPDHYRFTAPSSCEAQVTITFPDGAQGVTSSLSRLGLELDRDNSFLREPGSSQKLGASLQAGKTYLLSIDAAESDETSCWTYRVDFEGC